MEIPSTDIAFAQKEIIDRYFIHLSNFGYMPDTTTQQALFAVLLLDAVEYLRDFVTEEFTQDVARILSDLGCCNCAIAWRSPRLMSVRPFYSFNPTGDLIFLGNEGENGINDPLDAE